MTSPPERDSHALGATPPNSHHLRETTLKEGFVQKPENPLALTDLILESIKSSFGELFKVTTEFSITREKGYYGVCFAVPAAKVRTALSVDRELLILVSTFKDQQVRTIQTARDVIAESGGRLDSSTFVVIHRDI
jgi:hypothetical protein